MEVLRYSSTVPLTIRATTTDVLLGDVLIPKDTVILGMFAEVLKGGHWDDGDVFRPSRFINKEGNICDDEKFVPFGIGKRACPGKYLAEMELFLYFTRIVQLFDFHPLDEMNLPKETFTSGVGCTPTPFQLIISSRK